MPDAKIKETRKIEDDKARYQELLEDRTTEKKFLNKNLVYENNPASGISVKLSGEGEYKMYTTDNEGELNVSKFIDLLHPRYFFRNYSERELEERIGNIFLVQQIKPRTLETLMEDLIQAISPKEINIKVETKENPILQYVKIVNDSETFKFKGSQLTDDAIYQVVREFVDEEINSHIKSLTFVVKDNVSHVPIDGSNFDFKLNAPRKEDLAREYFTQDLKNYAQRCIKNYIEGNTMIGDCPSRVFFDIYAPSMIQVEITNPDYNFVSGGIFMDDEDLEKKVYMVDKGSKIRVQDADNERGRIE